MADAYRLETTVDRYLLEDGSGVLLTEGVAPIFAEAAGTIIVAGASTAQALIAAAAQGSIAVTGASAGVLDVAAAAQGSIAVTGAAASTLDVAAAAAGAIVVEGGAAAVAALTGAAAGAIAVAAGADAAARIQAGAQGSIPVAGSATGEMGAGGITAEAAGSIPVMSAAEAQARIAGAAPAGAIFVTSESYTIVGEEDLPPPPPPVVDGKPAGGFARYLKPRGRRRRPEMAPIHAVAYGIIRVEGHATAELGPTPEQPEQLPPVIPPRLAVLPRAERAERATPRLVRAPAVAIDETLGIPTDDDELMLALAIDDRWSSG